MKKIFSIIFILLISCETACAMQPIFPGPLDVNMRNIKRNFEEMQLLLCTSEVFTMTAGQSSIALNVPGVLATDNAAAAIKEPASIAVVSRNISIVTPAQNITVPAQNITFTVGTESVTITVPAQTVSVPSQSFSQGVTFPVLIKNVTASANTITISLTEPTPVNLTGEILIHKKIIEKRY